MWKCEVSLIAEGKAYLRAIIYICVFASLLFTSESETAILATENFSPSALTSDVSSNYNSVNVDIGLSIFIGSGIVDTVIQYHLLK